MVVRIYLRRPFISNDSFAIERTKNAMNYMVKSYFAIDERSSGTWKEEGF